MEINVLAFALFLMALSAGLLIAHVYTWRSERTPGKADTCLDFAWRKFRRRMQASLMIGLTGVALVVSHWLPKDPLVYIVYWAGVALWVVWIALLAMADVLATQHHFRRLRRQQVVDEARLRVQLHRHHQKGNGHARSSSDTTTSAGGGSP